MRALLEIDSLRITTRDGTVLLDDVSLDVRPGEALAVVGESGSGKTLTCRSVLGSVPRGLTATGQVRVDGQDVLAMTPRELRRHRSRDVALVAQDPRSVMNPVTRVGAFLTEALVDAGGMRRSLAEARARDVLSGLGFDDPAGLMRHHPHELSGGMLQRLVIAAAVLTEPRIVIADESTSALDVTNQAEVARLLGSLCRERGMALVFVTHDLDLATAVGDRVAVMWEGAVLEVQESAAVYTSPQHPYTAELAACRPQVDRRVSPLPVVRLSGRDAVPPAEPPAVPDPQEVRP